MHAVPNAYAVDAPEVTIGAAADETHVSLLFYPLQLFQPRKPDNSAKAARWRLRLLSLEIGQRHFLTEVQLCCEHVSVSPTTTHNLHDHFF
jgi:hypothetical protein